MNGPNHVPSSIMGVVLSSATEDEMGTLFYNAKDAAWLRTKLADLGHSQPPMPIQTDNACAAGILNDTVKQRRSKAIDMRFYWVRDRVRHNQFVVHWRRGTDNLAGYFHKSLFPVASPPHAILIYLHWPAPGPRVCGTCIHRHTSSRFLCPYSIHTSTSVTFGRGCVEKLSVYRRVPEPVDPKRHPPCRHSTQRDLCRTNHKLLVHRFPLQLLA